MDLKVICLETEAYYNLIQEIVEIVKEKEKIEDLWVDGEEAMSILKIGKTTLQKYRDQQLIVFSQPSRKVIVYYRPSLLEFLEKNIANY